MMLHEGQYRDVGDVRTTSKDVKDASKRTVAERRTVHAYSIDAILGLAKTTTGLQRCGSPSGTDSGSETASNGT